MAVEMFPKTEESIIKEAQFDPKAVETQPKPQSKFKNPKIIIAIVIFILIALGLLLTTFL